MEEKNCSQDISKYINPEELPSFIPQQLKDLIENNIDAFPAAVGKQIGTLSEFRNKKEWALQRAAAAKEKANAAKMKEVKWYKSSKDVIEALQQACESQSEAIEANAEAHQASFQNQQKMAEVSKSLLALGLANSALNRMIIREITLKLQNASKEELNDLARQELESVLRQLKSQEDLRERIEKQKLSIAEQKESIDNLYTKFNEFKNKLSQENNDFKSKQEEQLEHIRKDQQQFLSTITKEQQDAIAAIHNNCEEQLNKIQKETNKLKEDQDQFKSVTREQAETEQRELKKIIEAATENQKKFNSDLMNNIDEKIKGYGDLYRHFVSEQAKLIEEQEHKIAIYKIVVISSVVLSIVSVALSIIL